MIFSILTAVLFFIAAFLAFIVKKTSSELLQSRQEQARLEERNLSLLQERDTALNQIQSIQAEFSASKTEINALTSRLSIQETTIQFKEEKIREQRQEVLELQSKLTLEFEQIAQKLLEEKSKKFTDQNKENIDQILKPLDEKIQSFQKKVEEAYDKELRDKVGLKEELKRLNELNIRLSTDATNLTNALKGENKTQGNWGELILESILDRSGLVKNREYFVQQSYQSEEGKRFQPDVILHLPEEKRIVIDSKVSLVDFERYFNCEDAADKQQCLNNHLQSIRRHIKQLGDKNYQNLYSINSLDFILLFMPVEPAFSLATQHDAELFNFAFDRNIVIVSPSTLLATLRTIASIWKYEYQNRNAQQIAKEGAALYDKFEGLITDLKKVKSNLQTVTGNFDSAFTRLEGNGGIMRRVENLKALGVKPSKNLQKHLSAETVAFDALEESAAEENV